MTKTLVAKGTGGIDFVITYKKKLSTLKSTSTQHFTDSFAQNPTEQENIPGLQSSAIVIVGVTIRTVKALHYELQLYEKDTFTNADMDKDTYVGRIDLDMPIFGASR